MAGLGSVVIQFVGKDNLSRVAGTVARSIGGVDTESGKAKTSFGKLSAAWATAIPIAGAVIGAGVGIANVLVDAGKAALEDKESQDKLAKVLGTIPGVTQTAIEKNEAWISSMQLATLVADTELRQAVQTLALATGDLGEAQRLTTVAVDAAAGSGKNLSTIVDGLAKAANGNTSALKKQFPWLDANKDGTVTYTEAVDGLTKSFKGSASEAAKTKPWETLKTVFDELKESVGQWLLPVMEDLAEWFKKPENQQKIQDLIDKVGDLAEDLGEDLLKAFKNLLAWLKKPENQQKIKEYATTFMNVAREVGDLADDIETLLSWINKLPSNIVLNWITKRTGGGGDSGHAFVDPKARSTTAAQAAPPPTPIMVPTEEQLYRALSRVLYRGDARNGRVSVFA